jgi:hypothetical protein
VIRGALLGLALAAMTVQSAAAQTSQSTASTVGSAALRNGYPIAGGAIALPAAPNLGTTATPGANGPVVTGTAGPSTISPGATGAGTTGAGTTGAGATGAGGAAGFGASGSVGSGSAASGTPGSAAATSGAPRSLRGRTGGRGGGTFVVCPPDGASGEAALFTGTDLSCAPD